MKLNPRLVSLWNLTDITFRDIIYLGEQMFFFCQIIPTKEGNEMKGNESKNNPYATNEAGVIKAPKAKPAQPKSQSIKGNDLRTRGGKK